jgi:hypothetical protein
MHVARTLTLMLLCFALAGCELVANFDRAKIPGNYTDAGAHDAGKKAMPGDAGTPDAADNDAG